MTIQLSLFLYIYLAFIAVFLFYTFFNLYHIIRFGFVSFWAYFLTFAYIGLSIIALFISYIYIAEIDWSATLTVFQIIGKLY
ncbi:hypothetical protein A2533_00020 [Candidatus Falkowbacteria bacterium RIFOXYD2_FULL_35_9]|uniref:Uncharacterized protein n=1 Tax=Candidatus Falkowbacteria bacterium RIFOXYC2_FULL_36_12 TaxID=1798002 RepID=A0A1F5T3X5_9BACT|nr:MAG: hypothetical protein A2300_02910 [Candidatus Falkowbacteria bacterium RIFOXYB2_FULL_35_7]OGF33433.1 MAG: hypothetical protein A2478_01925 [Candidatus Falkowbacteria bacterium RIFOXYC2_FULL_36_12]OGF47586.1 MAG: hypothetical protein A2533_00020 [Candidatus Falkowbacteria bacterium RIFOXYD2_FULL_35_9]